jgi:hypothetical protein
MSGKSTLGRLLMQPYLNAKLPVAVYSPVEPPTKWDERAAVFDNFFGFLNHVRTKMPEGGLLVIDEADTVLAQGDRENWWVGTRSRHFGFRVIILTQRPTLVAPTVRGQCGDCFLFNIGAKDSRAMADDYNAPGLLDGPKMKKGHFLHAHWSGENNVVDRGRVF